MTEEIKYTDHLKLRISLRRFSKDLPLRVYKEAERRFYDERSGHFMALKKMFYAGRERFIIVVYDVRNGVVELITVHPISEEQIEHGVKSGRWKLVE